MKLGARMLKTGIAIVLALYIAQLLQLPAPVFAGIGAVFAIQPTIYRSYLTVVDQIQGNIIGALIGIVCILLFGNHIFIIGFAAIITIIIMVKLKLEDTIRLALVTIIAIMEAPVDDFLQFSLLRTSTIFVGILSSFIVNLIFLPPKYETKLFHSIASVTEDIVKWMRLTPRFASEDQILKKDLAHYKKKITEVNQLFEMYKEERRYFQRPDYSKRRKLVIYRQMIQVTQKIFDILNLQYRYGHHFQVLPEPVMGHIRDRLDFLLSYHEQLHLMFLGKVRAKKTLNSIDIDLIHKDQLMDLCIEEIRKSDMKDGFQQYHFMHILSDVIGYEEQLEHLERLINTLRKFHKTDSQVQLNDES